MTDQFDVRQGFRVYHKVVTNGEADQGAHVLQGIHASSDFDGYTLHLSDQEVDLYIYFHNSYKLEYRSKSALSNFLQRMQNIDDAQ